MIELILIILVLLMFVRNYRHLFYVHPTPHIGGLPENSFWVGQIHAIASRREMEGADTCIIYFHGNSGTADAVSKHAFQMDTSQGVPVVVFDYRGFGCSPTPAGGITPATMCDDAAAFVTHMKHLPPPMAKTRNGRCLLFRIDQ